MLRYDVWNIRGGVGERMAFEKARQGIILTKKKKKKKKKLFCI